MTKSSFVQRLSSTVQFILGFVLGISLIAGISGTVIFAYYKKMSTLPKKPAFPEVPAKPSASKDIQPSTSIEPLESKSNMAEESEKLAQEEAKLESKPESELPPNAYRAEVTWPQGLSLRAEPDVNAERIGGVGFEENIIILEDSADGEWQRVRIPGSEQEGWVKGGNTKRTSE